MLVLSLHRVHQLGRIRPYRTLIALSSAPRLPCNGSGATGHQRLLHLSSGRFSSEAVGGNPASTSVLSSVAHADGITETSARAKWAADASSIEEPLTTPIDIAGTLPPQGELASIGLGGYTPVGLVQNCLDWIHLNTGLPWWASIVVGTVILRSLMLPLVIKLQVNAARLNQIRPETDVIMARMKEYQQMGNTILAAQENARLLMLYRKHNCNPVKMMIMPFLQFPVFISFFIALRRMAQAPIESMKDGGLFWFTDLTLPDPYYILPITSSLLFMANIELGGEAGVTNPQMEKMKLFFRIMSVALVPLTATFPTALFMYWITASFYSMGQILVLKVPAVRTRLGIPNIVNDPFATDNSLFKTEDKTSTTSQKKKPSEGMVSSIRKSMKQSSLIAEAKQKTHVAKKKYNKQLKDKNPKLYDKPPHKR
ncbi:PREDICTED: mitochondrial inner membrane protein OXA1L-like [Amphimedon queenslandica]|uniref:Membrane insertase YidC/Oxa/ALB C-terminal domain-containing protein n=1 Tax=Amphimedon queenslandica TaxID=400682 RepID=A0A1X7VNG9_AMPQE|nr:PREDICTED: mitochondrial inner membrane protein OXA1L-like [Amphimedon queenslandica]|eukprot:XP_003383873.1 PREDICTED: mitochondrial inner membrane protein OXA1L-like [Amphimedon queenslandica]